MLWRESWRGMPQVYRGDKFLSKLSTNNQQPAAIQQQIIKTLVKNYWKNVNIAFLKIKI